MGMVLTLSVAGVSIAHAAPVRGTDGGHAPVPRTDTPTRGLASRFEGTLKVAVFGEIPGFVPEHVANMLNTTPGIDARVVNRQRIAAGLDRFDVLLARFGADTPNFRLAPALAAFVAGGGAFVGDWWGGGAAMTSLGVPERTNYYQPERFIGLVEGTASDGDVLSFNRRVTITVDHPIFAGVPAPIFRGSSGTEFFVHFVTSDPRVEAVATFHGWGQENPAILVGDLGSARTVLFAFDACDSSWKRSMRALITNSVIWAGDAG